MIITVLVILAAVLIIALKDYKPGTQSPQTLPTTNALVTTRVRVFRDCYWRFRHGWNHKSFCVNKTNYSVTDVLTPINGDYRFVLRWNASRQSFQVYSPLSSNNDFQELAYNESFFVLYIPNETYIQDSEEYFEDVNASLLAGWNAVPYPYEFPANFSIISPNLGDYRFILKWNETRQEFDVYSPRSSQNTIETVYVGEGYMAYLNNPHVLDYIKSTYPR